MDKENTSRRFLSEKTIKPLDLDTSRGTTVLPKPAVRKPLSKSRAPIQSDPSVVLSTSPLESIGPGRKPSEAVHFSLSRPLPPVPRKAWQWGQRRAKSFFQHDLRLESPPLAVSASARGSARSHPAPAALPHIDSSPIVVPVGPQRLEINYFSRAPSHRCPIPTHAKTIAARRDEALEIPKEVLSGRVLEIMDAPAVFSNVHRP